MTGLFVSPAAAVAALETLENRGVPPEQISVIATESARLDWLTGNTGSRVGAGAAVGAGVGGVLGALLAVAMVVGGFVPNGVGVLAVGPLLGALAGAGAGAVAGSLVGGAWEPSLAQFEAEFYESMFEHGAVLVGVAWEDDDRRRMVLDVFRAHGARRLATT